MATRKHHKTKYPGVYYRETGQGDKTYEVCYRDAAGKLCWHTVGRHSTGIRPAYANQVRGKLLEEVAAGKNPAAARGITVGEAVDAYLAWADAEGKNTGPDRNRYERHLRSRLNAMPIMAVTPQILIDTKQVLAQTLGDQSLRHAFGFLRRAVNHVIEVRGLGIANPFAVKRNSAFRLPRAENAAVRFLTPDEAHQLLAELGRRSRQAHDMALLSLSTGMRLTEIFSVTGQDVDHVSKVVHFTAKGGQRQHVPASEGILDMLTGYDRAPGELVFQARDGGPMRNGISRTFERAVEALGFNDGVTDSRRRVRFHTLRHTFASWLAQSGQVTLHELMEHLRHERIEMTLRYAHLIPGHQRDKLRIIEGMLAGHD
ncbi:MAG: tyrosine-type recombinase/integrase [Desulfovibrio sp.]